MPNRRQRKKNARRWDRVSCRYRNRAVMVVQHAALRRWSDSMFKSECPRCHYGLLPVARDSMTFQLLDLDRCVLCGQRVRYTDMDRYRRLEAGE